MTEWIEVGKLTPSEINPRGIQEHRFERLKRSLSSKDGDHFFNVRPCLVNKREGKLIIYGGNMRYRAAVALKWERVPCIVETLPLAVEKERMIKDNVAQGQWDDDLLSSHFDTADLREWGFDPADVGYVQEPEPEEKPKKKKTCPECGHEF